MQVGTADPARLDLDQHLAEAGLGIGDVVADDHGPAAQGDGAHQAPPCLEVAAFSSTWLLMAFMIA